MKESQLNRVINLVKRTGDKAVILDQASDEVLVLMSLDSYESYLQPDTGKNNSPNLPVEPDFDIPSLDWGKDNWEKKAGQSKNLASLSQKIAVASTPPVATPLANKEEVDLTDIPHEEIEEKFYLEPVE